MKYYKILNEEEIHYSMQYRTGLNVDIQPFNPSGDCKPGGVYFSREDILAFIDFGPWIREVKLPKDGQIYENPGTPKKWKADKVILGRKYKITPKLIEKLIKEGANIHVNDDLALQWASGNGHLEIVRLLIENGANIHAKNDYALRWASEKGHLEIVQLLLENGANVHANNNLALQLASENGHLEIVKLLLENGANIHVDDDYALQLASENGHTRVIELLKEYKQYNG